MLSPVNATPAVVIERADAQFDSLAERLWVAVADDDLLDAISALEEHEARVAAVRVRLLTEIMARELPRKSLSWSSTGDWYAHLAGLSRGAAHRTVRHARALSGDREATLAAMQAGAVSAAQASVICEALDELPTNPTLRAEAENLLIAEAAHLDATQLAQAGRRVISVVDPDHDERKAEADLAREERAAHHERHLSISEDGAGGVRVRGRGTAEDGAKLRAALLPLTSPRPARDQAEGTEGSDVSQGGAVRDPRDHGARLWDALVGLAQHSLDTDVAPESHGARPRLSVLIDLDALLERLRDDSAGSAQAAITDDGLRISHAAVRRLACDADLIPVVLGGTGQPLDVGRTHRLITTAIWLALIARDRHCAFPGCTRPPVMCHAHHVRHWADGGSTSIDNLVMLCGHHHRTVHDTAWHVRLAADGQPEFLPPPRRRGDPPPETWIRHRSRSPGAG